MRERATGRGRRIAWGAVIFTVVLAVAGGWVGRAVILERWWIHRLGSPDPQTRAEAAKNLGRWGSANAATAIFEGLERGTLEEEALGALEEIEKRVDPRSRVVIVRDLLSRVEAQAARTVPADQQTSSQGEPAGIVHAVHPGLCRILTSAASRTPEALPFLVEALAQSGPRNRLAVVALAYAWPASAGAVREYLSAAPLGNAKGFLRSLAVHQLDPEGLDSSIPEPSRAVWELFTDLARDHQRPEVRALALAAGVLHATRNAGERMDLEILRGGFEKDRNPLVKRAALRVAGVLGHVPGNLDLPALLLEENDPGTLREIIQARTLWAFKIEPAGLEVVDGMFLSCGEQRENVKPLPFSRQEIDRLREVLAREKDPALRDAASIALTMLGDPDSDDNQAPSAVPAPVAGLVAHEWGVWAEAGSALLPAEKLVADPPEFVHRSRLLHCELQKPRTDRQRGTSVQSSGTNIKPAIFFRSREPLTLRVQVFFLGGRTWTFAPETGFLEASRQQGSPPDPASTEASGDPDGRDQPVPWLRSARSDEDEGSSLLDLEWRGLRVGYHNSLEGPLPPAPAEGEPGSWWRHLRAVPASSVALRGEREQFLFYEGAIRLPSPLLVRWLDGSRKSLVLRTRNFKEVPKLTDWRKFPLETLRARGIEPPPPTENLPGALVIRKDPGRPARGRFVANFPSRSPPVRVDLEGLDLEGEALRDRLRAVLLARGLTEEEALALLRSWDADFFGRDGLRVLTVLPRWMYDGLLPLDIDPAPEETVRVGLVWKECDERLEVEPAQAASAEKVRFPEQAVSWATSRVAIREWPLEPGPVDTFEVEPGGRLIGIDHRTGSLLLSAGGKRFAHTSRDPLAAELRLVDLETRTWRRILRLRPFQKIADLSISRDGYRIATLIEHRGKMSAHVLDALRGVRLDVFETEARLSWSFLPGDDRTLAFMDEDRLRLVDLETGVLRSPVVSGSIRFQLPVFTPDGRKAALLFSEAGKPDDPWRVGLLDLLQGRLLAVSDPKDLLTYQPGTEDYPVPSDDGRRVLYRVGEEKAPALRVADLENGAHLLLPQHEGRHQTLPTLTGDGKRVLFCRSDSIWAIDLDTGKSKALARFPGLLVYGASASADGKHLLLDVHDQKGKDERLGIYFIETE